jgi:hypothetical protein
MSKLLLSLFTFFVMSVFFLGGNQVFASGTPEELKVTNTKNGVMYVTTDVETSTVSSTTTISTRSAVSGGPIRPPVGFVGDINELINLSLRVVFVIAALLVFAFLIMGAIQWITSGGEKSKTEAARNKIIAAIIGLVIVVSSFAIMTLIVRVLGYNSINDVILLIQSPTNTATDSSQLRNQNLVK